MITEEDLYSVLSDRVPGLQAEIKNIAGPACPYKLAAFFAAYAKKCLKSRNYVEVRKCFLVAEDLIRNGSYAIKNAMNNVFVYSISNAIGPGHPLYMEFPDLLKEEYKRQVNAIGI